MLPKDSQPLKPVRAKNGAGQARISPNTHVATPVTFGKAHNNQLASHDKKVLYTHKSVLHQPDDLSISQHNNDQARHM
jgi:hypothetical protein